MKQIKNWQKASVADLETDNLLFDLTKIHIVGIKLHDKEEVVIKGDDLTRINKMLDYHIDNEIPIVGHNFICFDVPAMEKVLERDLSKLMVVDTMALSWYLNINNKSHSIETLAKDYGGEQKYFIDEDAWENLSWEDAVERVSSDVRLNHIIWEDFKERLREMYSLSKEQIDLGNVGGTRIDDDEVTYVDSLRGLSVDEHIDRLLTFLMFKMDCLRLQEKTMWEVDVEYLKQSQEELSEFVEHAAKELESVMPDVPKYTKRNKPKVMYKQDGTVSAAGKRWNTVLDKYKSKERDDKGNLLVIDRNGDLYEITKYDPPNIASSQQVKDFLFSKGWEPQTFNYVRDDGKFQAWIDSKPPKGSKRGAWTKWKNSKPEDRAIPQVTTDGEEGKELCPSVIKLISKVPEVKALDNYSMVKHRLGVAEGFLKNLKFDKYLQARASGFTNTLRLKHSECVNLPDASKPYAEALRGCLVAGEGNISIGSDLSSLSIGGL